MSVAAPLTIPVQVDARAIRHAVEHNPEFTIQFFLGDELTMPVPDFHISTFTQMISPAIELFACAIPRGHAKTTLAKLACVWYFLFSDFRFIVYLSSTSTIAQQACVDIIAFIEGENCISIFGMPNFLVRRPGEGLFVFKLSNKTCILRALGAKQQVRGININNQRPQLAIVDDLEDNDNIATETLFNQLRNWFYGPFIKCLDKVKSKVIQIGNMISNRCLLKQHCESKFWHSMRFGAILSNGESLWPDLWPIEELRKDFAIYRENGITDIWFAEMMNLPMAAGNGLIRAEEIYYRPFIEPGNHDAAFITIDLAITEKTWGHKTVVAVHAAYDEVWQCVEYEAYRGIDPIELFDIVVSLANRWQIVHVGIESVAYQASLQHVFRYLANEMGIQHLEFHQLRHYNRKIQRLRPWAALIKSKKYALNDGDYAITVELLDFDPTKQDNEDDIIDAYASGPEMIDAGNYDIIQNALYTDVKARNSVEVCRY